MEWWTHGVFCVQRARGEDFGLSPVSEVWCNDTLWPSDHAAVLATFVVASRANSGIAIARR